MNFSLDKKEIKMNHWIKLDKEFSPTIEYFSQKLQLPELSSLGKMEFCKPRQLHSPKENYAYNKCRLSQAYEEKRVFFLKEETRILGSNNYYISNTVHFEEGLRDCHTIYFVGNMDAETDKLAPVLSSIGEWLDKYDKKLEPLRPSTIVEFKLPSEWFDSTLRWKSVLKINGQWENVLKALYKNKFAFFFFRKHRFLKDDTYYITQEIDFDSAKDRCRCIFYILDEATEQQVNKIHEKKKQLSREENYRKISIVAKSVLSTEEGETEPPSYPGGAPSAPPL